MAVGCIVHLTEDGVIFHRQPCWPWPAPGVYPIQYPDGTWAQFFPHNYFRFTLGDSISPFPPVPYVSTKNENPAA